MRRHLYLFLFRVVSILAPVGAAGSVNLSGVVVDMDRHPLGGIDVSLAIGALSTRTDAHGAWSLSGTAGVKASRPMDRSRGGMLEVASGRIAVRHRGVDLAGRVGRGILDPRVLGARFGDYAADTLLVKYGTRTFRYPLVSTDLGVLDTALINTDTIQALDLRAIRYDWDGKRSLGLGLANMGRETFDSLRIRLFLNGKRAGLLDFAARIDVALHYRADGFLDTGLYAVAQRIQYARPRLIGTRCPTDSVCSWAFDMLFDGVTLAVGERWRLDVVFDRHNLMRDTTEILNMAPTHDPYAGTDWSFRAHVAGSDGGASVRDYAGIPAGSKNDIDERWSQLLLDPYIAVYRGDRRLYGYPP